MGATIREIINNPHLKSKIIAGEGGVHNEITWAHTCELDDPSNWLIGGELIMTNGMAIPKLPEDQVNYLQILINSKASGLAIGKDLHAPPLSEEFLSYADAQNFPVLLTDYEIPWIALAKTVAVHNTNEDYSRLLLVSKLYNFANKFIGTESIERLFDQISETIVADLQVIDPINDKILYETKVKEKLRITDDLVEEQHLMEINVPASRPMKLNMIPYNIENMDMLILNHLSTIIALFVERDIATYERMRRHGSEILVGLIEDQYSSEVISSLLKEHKLHGQDLFLCVCSTGERDFNSSRIHIILYELNIPNILTVKEDKLVILIPAVERYLEKLIKELPENTNIGISSSKKNLVKIKKMYKEATWALKSAKTTNKHLVFFNDTLSVSTFLPDREQDVKELVDEVLGDLIEYDTKNNSHLVKTLYVFLSENQSWKKAADLLFIHKQTLVYRINRIESIIGKKLNNINNVSEIWIALQAAIILNLHPDLS